MYVPNRHTEEKIVTIVSFMWFFVWGFWPIVNSLLKASLVNVAVNTRGSAIADRPAWRFVSVEMLSYCCTNNANRISARGALSATATFYSAPCIVLYTHCCNRLNYHTVSMRCSVSHNVLLKWAIPVINKLRQDQRCWCQMGHKCYQQTLTTTNVVDDTAYSSARAP